MKLQRIPGQSLEQRRPLSDLSGLVFRGALAAFLIQSTGLALNYASQVLLARWMDSVAEYSAYAIAFTWLQLLGVGAALGFTTAALRFIPEYITRDEDGRLVGFLRRSRQLVLAAGVVIAVAGTLVLMIVEGRPLHLSALRIGFWLVPLYALTQLQMQSIRGTRQVAAAFLPTFILQPLVLIAAAFAWLQWRGELTAVSGTVALALALAVAALVQRFSLVRAIPETIRQSVPAYDTRHWLTVSVPMLMSAGFMMIISNTDVILLGMLRSDGEAGIYFAASRTARQAAFMLAAVNAIVAPLISSQIAGGDREDLQRLVHLAAALVFVPSLIVAVVLLSLNQWILGLFGPEYLAGRNALFLLVLGQLVNALTGPVGILLSMGGHERRSTQVYGCCAVLNIGLNVLLISRFGLNGAAVATAVSLAAANLWLAVLVVRHMRIMPLPLLSVARAQNPTQNLELTSSMNVPNFLIIGAARSGTTALCNSLPQHPQIHFSPLKEPHFLAFHGQTLDFAGPGDEVLIYSEAVTDFEGYQQLFDGVRQETAIGEGSVSTLYYHRSAIDNIRRFTPDARLIVLLRNPIQRAYSSFLYMTAHGYEPFNEFERALDDEQRRISCNWHHVWHYTQMGFYSRQLSGFRDVFGPDRVNILLFEDLVVSP